MTNDKSTSSDASRYVETREKPGARVTDSATGLVALVARFDAAGTNGRPAYAVAIWGGAPKQRSLVSRWYVRNAGRCWVLTQRNVDGSAIVDVSEHRTRRAACIAALEGTPEAAQSAEQSAPESAEPVEYPTAHRGALEHLWEDTGADSGRRVVRWTETGHEAIARERDALGARSVYVQRFATGEHLATWTMDPVTDGFWCVEQNGGPGRLQARTEARALRELVLRYVDAEAAGPTSNDLLAVAETVAAERAPTDAWTEWVDDLGRTCTRWRSTGHTATARRGDVRRGGAFCYVVEVLDGPVEERRGCRVVAVYDVQRDSGGRWYADPGKGPGSKRNAPTLARLLRALVLKWVDRAPAPVLDVDAPTGPMVAALAEDADARDAMRSARTVDDVTRVVCAMSGAGLCSLSALAKDAGLTEYRAALALADLLADSLALQSGNEYGYGYELAAEPSDVEHLDTVADELADGWWAPADVLAERLGIPAAPVVVALEALRALGRVQRTEEDADGEPLGRPAYLLTESPPANVRPVAEPTYADALAGPLTRSTKNAGHVLAGGACVVNVRPHGGPVARERVRSAVVALPALLDVARAAVALGAAHPDSERGRLVAAAREVLATIPEAV